MSDLTRTQTVPLHRSCRNHPARSTLEIPRSPHSPIIPSSSSNPPSDQTSNGAEAAGGERGEELTEDHPERDEGEQRQEAPRPPPRHPRRISPRAMPTRGADRCRRDVLRRLLSACPCRGISALSALPPRPRNPGDSGEAKSSRRLRAGRRWNLSTVGVLGSLLGSLRFRRS